jgi:hypothetical protein
MMFAGNNKTTEITMATLKSQIIHGSPADRGSADSWYRRPRDPHYWPDGSYNGTRVEAINMTAAELDAYNSGYDAGERSGFHKEY